MAAPARTDNGSKPPPARTRIGTYTLNGPQPRTAVRVLVARYTTPSRPGMAEAAFTALTRGLVAEDTHTLRQGTIALDLRVTTTDEQVIPALTWGMEVLRVLLDCNARGRGGPSDTALLQSRRGGAFGDG